MSVEKLLKQIRSIVREEIEYALDKKINESSDLNEQKKSLNHGINLYKEATKTVKKQKTIPSNKNVSSIQELLEQTRRSMEESMMSEGDDMEMRFTTDSLNSFAGRIDATPSGIDPQQVAPDVAQALTRDYSALMAKIKEKKGR